jgi:molybdate transport system ATP-binding protein
VSLDAHIKLRLGALDLDAKIAVADGEVVAIVGPNGSGKTSVMRALAGLVPLSGGRIVLDDEVLEDPSRQLRVPAERRPVGFVFQDYLLFPHMSALENVAFGLRSRGMPRAQARDRAREWLERMGLASHMAARPRALSGGQAQRVALARALATDPRLLLLDEPTAALDAGAKVELRREIRRHLATFSGARLLVTHDPLEAATMADRLVVLEAGRMVQVGTPAEVSERPRSQYVAELIGINLLRGRAEGHRILLASGGSLIVATESQGEVFAMVHPRAVTLHAQEPEGSSARNVWQLKVGSLDLEGSRVRVGMDGEVPLVAEVTPAAVAELALAEGEVIWASLKATEVTIYPA